MTFELNTSLPFTSNEFFLAAGGIIILFQVLKRIKREIIPYPILLATVNLAYLILLYTNPYRIIGLIIYLFAGFTLLRKYYRSDTLFLPYIVLAMPMIFMKSFGIVEFDEGPMTFVKQVFQVAGISYMTFKVIGAYVDERNTTNPISLLSFFNFTAFVPTLLIGPIDRYKRFNSDMDSGYDNITSDRSLSGLSDILKGLVYKYILAYGIRQLIMTQLVDDNSLLYHLSYMYTYLIYLFFDFAGYSLLAIGFGKLLGVDVPINFNKPFNSVNPKEFWQKWHKSLGEWLNDYFFKPIFKYLTMKQYFTSIQRQSIALFLTFTLMGFWNGFELHYIVSGMLFGVFSVIHNYYQYQCRKQKRDVYFGQLKPNTIRFLSILIMFNLVAFAIYLFSGNLI